MDSAGLLCSANRGKDTNGSQYAVSTGTRRGRRTLLTNDLHRFFITLEPTPHLNGKHTIFGRLVSGEDVLEAIAKLDVDQNDRPIEPVLISRCGELEKRQKYTGPTSRSERNGTRSERAQLRAESNERGRRRESNPSEDDMGRPPTPERPRRTRRQSDNVVDEGLRGRPRQRSRSRSCSQPLSTPSEEISDYSDQYSPVKKHKRKRSASPSRHKDLLRPDLSTDSFSHDRRRRRSLPNQYPQEEQERYRPSPRRATDDRYAGNRRREDGYRSDRSDRYRPARDRYGDDGRLEVGAYDDYDYEPPVKFKGRGVMKFREPGRL